MLSEKTAQLNKRRDTTECVSLKPATTIFQHVKAKEKNNALNCEREMREMDFESVSPYVCSCVCASRESL